MLGMESQPSYIETSHSSLLDWKSWQAGEKCINHQRYLVHKLMWNLSLAKCVALALACLIFMSGCSSFFGPSYSDRTQQSHQLQTNLYGNLSGWQPVAFSQKPFSSLIQHSFCEEGGDYDPDLSADGKWVVFSSLRHAPSHGLASVPSGPIDRVTRNERPGDQRISTAIAGEGEASTMLSSCPPPRLHGR